MLRQNSPLGAFFGRAKELRSPPIVAPGGVLPVLFQTMKTQRVQGARRAKAVKKKGPILGLSKWEVAVVKEEKAERKLRGWSMQDVADAAGLTRQEISYIKGSAHSGTCFKSHEKACGSGLSPLSQPRRLDLVGGLKSLKKFWEVIKPFTRRTSGQTMSATAQKLRPRLVGFYNYFKHARASALAEVDRWIRVRFRSILRKRAGRRGKGRGIDHHRWPNCYFTNLGIFNLEEAQKLELMSLRVAGNF